MSKELVGKNGKQVGTQEYLDAINKSKGLNVWMQSGNTYADAMKTLCEGVKSALAELHVDLHRNEDSLSLISESDRKATGEMARQLRAIGVTLNHRSSDADACMKLLELRGGCHKLSTTQEKLITGKVEMVLKGHGAGTSQSDRVKMVEQLIKDNGKYKSGKGDKKDQFLALLADGKNHDKYFWKEVLQRIQYQNKPASLKGKNGEVLCSKAYITHIEKQAFGGSLISSGNKDYTQQIFDLFRDIIGVIKTDVTAGVGTDDYMIYENRKRVKAVVKELRNYISISYGVDADVEKLRRLEHFDNKVIVLKKDTHLPVSAELSWVKGKNILNIYANICFVTLYGQPPTVTEKRKKAVTDGFHKWSGKYMVFGDQPVQVWINLDIKHPGLEVKSWSDVNFTPPTGINYIFLITKTQLQGQNPFTALDDVMKRADNIHNNTVARSFAFRMRDMNRKTILDANGDWWSQKLLEFEQSLPISLPQDGMDLVNVMGMGHESEGYPELGEDLAKHEFGHLLGLGDMYPDPGNPAGLLQTKGIKVSNTIYPKGSPDDLTAIKNDPNYIRNLFPDLADYYLGNQQFDSVMYHNTAIHDNDIEMVIEAFHTGKRQNFQKQGLFGDEMPTVLGKGN